MSHDTKAEVDGEEFFPWCIPVYKLLQHHPIRPALESYHNYRLSQIVLGVLRSFDVTIFGGWLRRWIYSSNRIREKCVRNEDIFNVAEKCLQDCKTFNSSKFTREDFMDPNCDMDIRVGEKKQIPNIMNEMKKLGLQVTLKSKQPDCRYGTGAGINLTSVKVIAKDLLSGYYSQISLDFVYVENPELWTVDFNVNALELNSRKDLCSSNITIAENYIDKMPTQVQMGSVNVDMRDAPYAVTMHLQKACIISQINDQTATLNFERLTNFYTTNCNFEEIIMEKDIQELKVLPYGSVDVTYHSIFSEYPDKILLFYSNYMKMLFFRRLIKMKLAGFTVLGVSTKLLDMCEDFYSDRSQNHIQLHVMKNRIYFTYTSETIVYVMD